MDAITPRISLWRIATSYPARLTIYGIASFAAFQLVVQMLSVRGAAAMGVENGPLETTQVCLATFAAVCLFWAAATSKAGRAGLIACAGMVSYAAAREADVIFETLLFEDAYKYVVGLPMAAIILAAFWIYRKTVIADSLWLVRQPAITMFAIAGIYLCAMCQILDRPIVWEGLDSTTDQAASAVTATKGFVEEAAELFAYMLLAFSGIEALVLARSLRKASAQELDAAVTIPFPSEAIREVA